MMRDRAASAAYRRTKREERPEGQLARGLGWLSIAVGVAQVLAPRTVGRLTGMPIPPALMMLCGLREVACGIGILTQPKALAVDERPDRGRRTGPRRVSRRDSPFRASIASGSPSRAPPSRALTALDVYCARDLAGRERRMPLYVATSVIVERPADELYRFWRDLRKPAAHHAAPAIGGGRGEQPLPLGVPRAVGRPHRMGFRADRRSAGTTARVAHGRRFRRVQCGFGALHAARGRRLYRSHRELLYVPPAGAVGAAVARLFGKDAARTCSPTSPRSSTSWKRKR